MSTSRLLRTGVTASFFRNLSMRLISACSSGAGPFAGPRDAPTLNSSRSTRCRESMASRATRRLWMRPYCVW